MDFPNSTGVWDLMSGTGTATAVTLMADACGADARLVALMQCSRVVLINIWRFGLFIF
ncbi:AbrB family transcriptional regulator [Ectopseudomonas alcaliphila]|uniref:AbrB family transcriptional regulator n=1 Tax=Ectopseudomonas alcaliphila TaxID=101564 RepID=UPI00358E6029